MIGKREETACCSRWNSWDFFVRPQTPVMCLHFKTRRNRFVERWIFVSIRRTLGNILTPEDAIPFEPSVCIHSTFACVAAEDVGFAVKRFQTMDHQPTHASTHRQLYSITRALARPFRHLTINKSADGKYAFHVASRQIESKQRRTAKEFALKPANGANKERSIDGEKRRIGLFIIQQ